MSLEVSECDGVLLRGNRIIVPVSLRKHVVRLAHEGHQGIVKTKQHLRSKVWWPRIDKEAEKLCRECYECQVVGSYQAPEPIESTKLPEKCWDHLAVDLLGPLPNGESVIVLVDYFSRYFETAFVRSTTSNKVIEFLDNVFARWGLPLSLRTDNAQQFIASEFQSYLREHGIHWRSTTPLWAQDNGEVERQNRSLLKSLRVAQLSKSRDVKAEYCRFLMAYRSTPHAVTGVAPIELMTGRPMRTKLPCLERPGLDSKHDDIRDRDALVKLKSKELADANRHVGRSDVAVGDKVLVRYTNPQNKLSSNYRPESQTVVAREGSEVVLESESGTLSRRNVSLTRPLLQDNKAVGQHSTVTVHPFNNQPLRKSSRVSRPPERYGVVVPH